MAIHFYFIESLFVAKQSISFLTRDIANDHLVHVSNLDKQFLPPLFITLSNNLFWIQQREGCTVHQSWHFPSEDLNCNLVRLLFLLHKSESALLGYLSHQCSAYHTCAKNTQCGNFMIFLSLRFYVKSSFGTLEVLKSAIFKCTLLEALNFDV